ncbi:MAG: hypothetical protein LBV28_02380, partial [Puniceicoccales bacterium]|nr:hypothetical protein [Puniceicoccales bacterium]
HISARPEEPRIEKWASALEAGLLAPDKVIEKEWTPFGHWSPAQVLSFKLPKSFLERSYYIHQPHVENFLRAIRGEEKLNCDGTVAFESEVPLYRINDAVAAEKTLHFTAEDFDPFRAN